MNHMARDDCGGLRIAVSLREGERERARESQPTEFSSLLCWSRRGGLRIVEEAHTVFMRTYVLV